MMVNFDNPSSPPSVTVSIDKPRLLSSVRPAIQSLMTKLHIWRCSVDVSPATEFFEQLTEVDEFWLRIREVSCWKKGKPGATSFCSSQHITRI